MTRRPSVLAVALAVGAVAALTACSSGSTVSAAGTVAPTGSVSATTSTTTTPSASTSAPAATSGGDFCGTVRENVRFVTTGGMSSLLAGGTPAAWKAYLDATARANQQLVDAAPADLRPAMRTLQKDSDRVGTLMADANYDTSRVDSRKIVKAVGSSEHAAATQVFVTYVKTSCGLDLTKL